MYTLEFLKCVYFSVKSKSLTEKSGIFLSFFDFTVKLAVFGGNLAAAVYNQ